MRAQTLICFLIVFVNTVAQNQYQLLSDTTDAKSIVHSVQEIPEIEISSKNPLSNIKSGVGGVFIDVQTLKKLPSILGDADPFKALQYMGGISQAGDATANMHVRGGENDQNLILLNGMPMENPTHILGLFSVFNPDLIDQILYLKAGIPAEYGGRLSSVIDVKNFVNPPQKTELSGNLGIIASRLSLKSTIGDRFAYYAAARASYIQYAIMPLLLKMGIDPKLSQNNFEYYDINAGLNYRFKNGAKLAAHYYKGQDKVKVQDISEYSFEGNNSHWGNQVLGMQWSQVFSNQFSMTHSLNFSQFNLASDMNWLATNYLIDTDKKTYNLQSDFVYLKDKHQLKAGWIMGFNEQIPITIQADADDELRSQLPYDQSILSSIYLRDVWENGRLLLNIGLRANLYHKFPEKSPVSVASQQKTYGGIEPRMAMRIMLDELSAFKLSAGKHYQYTNRVQLINFGLPVEIFTASSERIKPASLWHFSGGYFRSFYDNNWETSAEIYYKTFTNLQEFGGTLNDLITAATIENLLHTGKGYTYGAEVMLRKNYGDFAGWINYTLGWNYRQFDDINNGKKYLASNDRRHDFSAVAMYHINDKWDVSATFVYATGSRLNLPRSWYVIDNKIIFEFSGYNGFKMPDYHRLDLSLTYKLPIGKQIASDINLSIFNVYNRANPFAVYFSTKDREDTYDYQIAMTYLMPVLPSISWTFHLK